jgi:uncharacterized protein YodC (DUF2158 family)
LDYCVCYKDRRNMFEIGDCVKLKTNSGPVMVVNNFEGGNKVSCIWFNYNSDGWELMDEEFSVEVLVAC